jgi:hypothetical protein
MHTFFERKLLPHATGILLAAAVMSGSQAAVAANVRAVSTAASAQGLENLLLTNIAQLPQGTTSPSPALPRVRRRVPVRIPEASTVVGLGVVAGSLAVTRRRVRVKN